MSPHANTPSRDVANCLSRVTLPRSLISTPSFSSRPSRQDLDRVDLGGAVADRRTQAVGAGVTTADDHDVLAVRGDRRVVEVALLHHVGPGQVLHRLVDAVELASGDRQVAPRGGAA